MSRIVTLDTETTGLDPKSGDRVVEIGCVELIDRRITGNHYHCYINPERDMPREAEAVHGLSSYFLSDKPLFVDIVDEFLEFIDGAEVVIHNAPFDVGFLNNELELVYKSKGIQLPPIHEVCDITDSLALARQKHPGQKNNLDALCNRYYIDNSHREMHGAYLDADILARVYLAMTGGQASLLLPSEDAEGIEQNANTPALSISDAGLKVVFANEAEQQAHDEKLATIAKSSGDKSFWEKLASN